MFCTRCGSELPEEVRFCSRCGESVEEPRPSGLDSAPAPQEAASASRLSDPAHQPSDSASPPSASQKLSAGAKAVVVVSALAVVAIVAFTVFFMMGRPSGEEAVSVGLSNEEEQGALQSGGSVGEASDPDDFAGGATRADGDASNGGGAAASHGAGASDGAASPASPVADGAPHTYANGRYGYHVFVPGSFALVSESDNGDGARYRDASTGMTLSVWGANNVLSETPEEKYEDAQAGRDVHYGVCEGDWYVVSYVEGGTVAYLKEFVGGGSCCTMLLEYPESASDACDALVEQIAPTFEPGNLSVSH